MGMRAGQRVEIEEQDGQLVLRKVYQDDPVGRLYGSLQLPDGWHTDAAIEAMRGPAELPLESPPEP